MRKHYLALSIVAPSATKIVQGIKTLEIRSWKPEIFPLKDLVLVENNHYLVNDGDEDIGHAVALVDIKSAHPWRKDEFEAACANYWEEGYWAWEIHNVRPIEKIIEVSAKRKLYWIEIEHKEN